MSRVSLSVLDQDRLLRAAFERTTVGLSFVTPDRRVLLTNPALTRILGYSSEEFRDLGDADLTHAEDGDQHALLHADLLAGRIDHYEVDQRYVHRDGHTVWALVHVAAIYDDDGRLDLLVSQVHDISARVAEPEEVTWSAAHDSLTGLVNRDRLARILTATMTRYGHRPESTPAVLFLDLDDFKQVNDQYGHSVGDDLLRSVASCLCNALDPGDTVARLGGDAFAVVLAEGGAPAEVMRTARRLHDKVARLKVRAHGALLSTTVSIGVAVPPPDDADQLLRAADQALYEAKRTGKNTVVLAGADRRPSSTV